MTPDEISDLIPEDPQHLISEDEWEEWVARRNRLRKSAQDDRRKAANRELHNSINHEISKSGGFDKWSQDLRRPTTDYAITWDIDKGNGVILPSVSAKGNSTLLIVPWALIEYWSREAKEEPELVRYWPFAQFDSWPIPEDFEWSNQSLVHGPTGVVRVGAALDLLNSEKNHYLMLTGRDKDVVDRLTLDAAQDWLSELDL